MSPPPPDIGPTAAIHADGRDPDLDPNPLEDPAFSARLRQMGVATPNPTLSNSSTASPFPPPPSSSSSSPSHASSSHRQQQPQGYDPRFPQPAGNATLGVLEARRRLQERAEAELEDPAVGARGRQFVDAGTLHHVLALRARGAAARDIEARFRLRPGVVARLGREGVVAPLIG